MNIQQATLIELTDEERRVLKGMARGQFPIMERLSEKLLALPANQMVSRDDIAYIGGKIRAVLG